MENNIKLLNIAEVCAILRCGRNAIYNRMKSDNEFPKGRILWGRARLWTEDEIWAWLSRAVGVDHE